MTFYCTSTRCYYCCCEKHKFEFSEPLLAFPHLFTSFSWISGIYRTVNIVYYYYYCCYCWYYIIIIGRTLASELCRSINLDTVIPFSSYMTFNYDLYVYILWHTCTHFILVSFEILAFLIVKPTCILCYVVYVSYW